MNGHIGVCGDNLLLGRELRALLEFEVTDGTGQGKVAIDTAEIDEATGSGDTGLLACSNSLSDPHCVSRNDLYDSMYLPSF